MPTPLDYRNPTDEEDRSRGSSAAWVAAVVFGLTTAVAGFIQFVIDDRRVPRPLSNRDNTERTIAFVAQVFVLPLLVGGVCRLGVTVLRKIWPRRYVVLPARWAVLSAVVMTVVNHTAGELSALLPAIPYVAPLFAVTYVFGSPLVAARFLLRRQRPDV